MRAAAWRPVRATVLVLLVTTLMLGLGLLVKDPCAWNAWDGNQFRALCYNDALPLYSIRHLDAPAFPFFDQGRDPDQALVDRPGFFEYPVLTALLMWTAAALAHSTASWFGAEPTNVDFFYWGVGLLTLLGLGTTLLLVRMAPAPRRLAYFAAGSPLVLYAFHNWDLLAVFLAVLGLYWFERGRWVASGVAVAAGASAKLFPLLFAPPLFLHLVREHYTPPVGRVHALRAMAQALARAAAAWRFTLGVVGGLVALHAPILLWGSTDLLLESVRFHLRRGATYETLWSAAGRLGERGDIGWLQHLGERASFESTGVALGTVAYAAVLGLVWTRRAGPRGAAFAAVLLFLLFNKVYSVQYGLWILPFFALVAVPAWAYAAFAAADLWIYAALFSLFAGSGSADDFNAAYDGVAWAVVARTAALAALVVLALRARTDPSPPHGASAEPRVGAR